MSRRVGAVDGTPTGDPEPGSGVGSAPRRQALLELPAVPRSVPVARACAREVLAEWGLSALGETAELLVSELVTNAIQVSRQLTSSPDVWLGLTSAASKILIAVWDASQQPIIVSSPAGPPDLQEESGRGLFLVEQLSEEWGCYWPEDGPGKVVWCTVDSEKKDSAEGKGESGVRVPLPKREPGPGPYMHRPASGQGL